VGILLGLVGAIYLYQHKRGLLVCWLGFFLPYTYFYLSYGAMDRDTMFGPSYLVWAPLIAYGLQHLPRLTAPAIKPALMASLPVLTLIVNFSNVDLSGNTQVRDHAEAVIESLPANAVVAGYWVDVAPLQYLHFVQHDRPDVTIYDLFQFKPDAFHAYMDSLSKSGERPIVFVTSAALTYVLGTPYTITPIPIKYNNYADPLDMIFIVNAPNKLLLSTGQK
jgi:hypothetical protein